MLTKIAGDLYLSESLLQKVGGDSEKIWGSVQTKVVLPIGLVPPEVISSQSFRQQFYNKSELEVKVFLHEEYPTLTQAVDCSAKVHVTSGV